MTPTGERPHTRTRNQPRPRPRRRKRRRQLRIFPVFLLFTCFAGIFYWGASRLPFFAEASNAPTAPVFHQKYTLPINWENLHSPYGVLISYDKQTVLSESRSTERIYPASLTKIMTALLAIEHTSNLQEPILLTNDVFTPLYQSYASVAGFLPNEQVRREDLLYGVLLPSGAECCLAFAIDIAGSEAAFVNLMNEKAAAIGMKNTHFTNSTGLHDNNHYSTAEDIGILLNYALKNNTFRKIFTSKSHVTHPTPEHPNGITLTSTMFTALEGISLTGGEIIGGKTGYTKEAGQCLASLANVQGKEYILVTAGAINPEQTIPFHTLDAAAIYHQITLLPTNLIYDLSLHIF